MSSVSAMIQKFWSDLDTEIFSVKKKKKKLKNVLLCKLVLQQRWYISDCSIHNL